MRGRNYERLCDEMSVGLRVPDIKREWGFLCCYVGRTIISLNGNAKDRRKQYRELCAVVMHLNVIYHKSRYDLVS